MTVAIPLPRQAGLVYMFMMYASRPLGIMMPGGCSCTTSPLLAITSSPTSARIAEKSPLALRLAKQAVLAAYELPLADGLALERRGFARLCSSADKREGVAAFREKRKPHFTGR